MDSSAPPAGPSLGPRDAPYRVVVADDHTFYRDGLVGLLQECDVEVVGAVPSGEAALEVVPRSRPDVVVMDLSMPGIGGVEATRRLVDRDPGAKVIMLTVSQEEEDILEAIFAGARGFVLKDGPVEDVVTAIERVVSGLPFFSPKVAPRLLRHVDGSRDGVAGPNRLSPREKDVLTRIAAGDSPAGVADAIGVPESGVHGLVAGILLKLQAESRGEIAVRAIRDRIV